MKKIILGLIIILSGWSINAQDIIWLSNTPPDFMKDRIKTSGMHRFSALKSDRRSGKPSEKEHKYNKFKSDSTKKGKRSKKESRASYYGSGTQYVQWIRQGSSVENARYICLDDSTDYTLMLMSPTSEKSNIEMVKSKACYLKFAMPDEGYYNAYLIVKKTQGDTLHINIAKVELLNHSCRNGHHKKLEARPVMHYPEITDFEVIRKRHPYEDFHYFSSSGDEETYQALFNGKPVEGVKITMNTEKGWSKTVYTDKEGKVNIQFLQDYFSKWQELNGRKVYYYLLEADYTVNKETEYKGKVYPYVHYTLSMSDGYHPARTMYASMVWGLIVFLLVTVVSIAGIFIYKERRKKPYKELQFDEK